ncbi:alpha/beta hydrolase, partial [Bacillus sp. JR_15]
LEKEYQFTNRIRQVPMNGRLLVGVGELEKHHPCQMNAHAKSLANRMQPLSTYGLHTAYHEFPEEGHTSVLPVLMNYAFRFALYHDDLLTTTDMKER